MPLNINKFDFYVINLIDIQQIILNLYLAFLASGILYFRKLKSGNSA